MRKTPSGFEAFDPQSGRSLPLNEYEVSLVRMLNGVRTMPEIVDASTRLGIPINLESLQRFIVRLDEHGFVNASGTGASPAWPPRGQWDHGARSMFQSGIRMLRTEKYAEAADYFEALLQSDPENVEAAEMLALCNKHIADARNKALGAMVDQRLDSIVAPGGPAPVVRPAAPQGARQVWLVGIGVLVMLSAATVAFFVMRSHKKQSAAVAQTVPAHVAPDAQIRTVADAPVVVNVQPAPADAAVPVATVADAGVADAASAVVADAGVGEPAASAADVQASAYGDLISFLRKPRAVKVGDKLFVIRSQNGDMGKVKTAAAKVADLQKLAAQDPTYEPFLSDARAELAAARKKVSVVTVVVKAPRAGMATPRVKEGATVHAGQVLATIE